MLLLGQMVDSKLTEFYTNKEEVEHLALTNRRVFGLAKLNVIGKKWHMKTKVILGTLAKPLLHQDSRAL